VGETGVFCLPNKNEKGIERCPKNDVTIKNLWYIAKSWEKKKNLGDRCRWWKMTAGQEGRIPISNYMSWKK
jgi:hypothetical protein